jgi:hypothetical protein
MHFRSVDEAGEPQQMSQTHAAFVGSNLIGPKLRYGIVVAASYVAVLPAVRDELVVHAVDQGHQRPFFRVLVGSQQTIAQTLDLFERIRYGCEMQSSALGPSLTVTPYRTGTNVTTTISTYGRFYTVEELAALHNQMDEERIALVREVKRLKRQIEVYQERVSALLVENDLLRNDTEQARFRLAHLLFE